MKLTFEITWPCAKCKQSFTDLDFTNSNYYLTILPSFILQHQTCPKTKAYSKDCQFTFLKDI